MRIQKCLYNETRSGKSANDRKCFVFKHAIAIGIKVNPLKIVV